MRAEILLDSILDKERLLAKLIIYGCFMALGILAPMALGPLTGLGPWNAAGSELFLLLFPAGLALTVLLSFILLFFKKWRQRAIENILVSIVLALLFIPTVSSSYKLRSLGFYYTGKRAEPLIAAIKLYQERKGVPPESLDILIPEYLAKMPYGIPGFQIHIFPDQTWQISASTSVGMLNSDAFIYKSDLNYDDELSYERLGDWVYLHK